jgi:hypothetical protein
MIRFEDLGELNTLYRQMLETIEEETKDKVLINPEIEDDSHPLERYDVASETKFNLGDFSARFNDDVEASKILLFAVNNNTVYKVIQDAMDECKDDYEAGNYSPEVGYQKLIPVVDTAEQLYNETTEEQVKLSFAQRQLIARQLLFHFTKDLKKAFNIPVDTSPRSEDYPTTPPSE